MKKPSEIIQKYIISLRNNQERFDYVNREVLPKIQNAEIFNAIDCQSDNLNDILSDNQLKLANTFNEIGRSGQLACFLSHYQVWKKIVENETDVCLVLEDDIKLYKNFNKTFDKIYDNLPVKFDYVHLFIHPEKQKIEYLEANDGEITFAEDNFGTVAYLISLKGARKLLKLTNLLKIQAPVDRFINFCIEHKFLKGFMVKKPFVITKGEILPNKSIYPNSYKSTIWYSPSLKDININETNISQPGINEEDLNILNNNLEKINKETNNFSNNTQEDAQQTQENSQEEVVENANEPQETKEEVVENADEPQETKEEEVENADEPQETKEEVLENADEPQETKEEVLENADEPQETKEEEVENADEPQETKEEELEEIKKVILEDDEIIQSVVDRLNNENEINLT